MPRRTRSWARTTFTLQPLANDRDQASLDSQFATEYGTTRLPIGTTIGGFLVNFQAVQTVARASSTDALWLGIIVTDEDTALETPDPYTEPHSNWVWRVQVPTGSASGTTRSTFEALAGPIRVKAMRKVDELGIRPWFVAHNFGTTTWDIHADISSLLILP